MEQPEILKAKDLELRYAKDLINGAEKFIRTLPFLRAELYGEWKANMAHIDGLENVEELATLKDPQVYNSKEPAINFTGTSMYAITVEHNKLFSFEFFFYCWIDLLRNRKILLLEGDLPFLTEFVALSNNKGSCVSNEEATLIYSQSKNSANYDVVLREIESAFIEQCYSQEQFYFFVKSLEL
ncbi:TPA: hypothetical protein ACGIK9_002809 [Acinetobacter baumannii]|uniref:hypothetical protein n=1 Tax=Acinetobacter baumannii TaxID=470 RepID=UPI00339016E7